MTTTEDSGQKEKRRVSASERRAEILEMVKKFSWFVMKTRGMQKTLADRYGVDRGVIYDDFQLLAQQVSVADIGQIEMDTRHLFSTALARAAKMADDPTLPARERARFNAQLIAGLPRQAGILEAFGKKDRDMAPPPMKESRPDDRWLDEVARSYAAEWRLKNRPPKQEGV